MPFIVVYDRLTKHVFPCQRMLQMHGYGTLRRPHMNTVGTQGLILSQRKILDLAHLPPIPRKRSLSSHDLLHQTFIRCFINHRTAVIHTEFDHLGHERQPGISLPAASGLQKYPNIFGHPIKFFLFGLGGIFS